MKILILEDSESKTVKIVQKDMCTTVQATPKSIIVPKKICDEIADTFAIYARYPILDWAVAEKESKKEVEQEEYLLALYEYFNTIFNNGIGLKRIIHEYWDSETIIKS